MWIHTCDYEQAAGADYLGKDWQDGVEVGARGNELKSHEGVDDSRVVPVDQLSNRFNHADLNPTDALVLRGEEAKASSHTGTIAWQDGEREHRR